jgi:hypothetical protein
MGSSGRRKMMALFRITLGAVLVVLAVVLNVGYVAFSWRTGLMVVLGDAVLHAHHRGRHAQYDLSGAGNPPE